METYNDYNDEKRTNAVYKLEIWKPSIFKVFIEYSNYLAYGNNKYDWEKLGENKTRPFISVGLIYNKDWFFKH